LGNADPAKVVQQGRPPQPGHFLRAQPSTLRSSRRQIGDPRRVPASPGRFKVGEVSHRLQRQIQASGRDLIAADTSREHRLPGVGLV
jgi:hypothetical protein